MYCLRQRARVEALLPGQAVAQFRAMRSHNGLKQPPQGALQLSYAGNTLS